MLLNIFWVLSTVGIAGLCSGIENQNATTSRTTIAKEMEEPLQRIQDLAVKPNDSLEIRDEKLTKSWKSTLQFAKNGIDSVIKSLLPELIRTTSQVDLSAECQASFLKLIGGIRNFKYWAISMVDSTGKLPVGLTRGTLFSLGDYDLCLSITVKEKTKLKPKIVGKYCSVIFTPQVPKNVKLDFVNLTGPNTIFSFYQDKLRFLESMKFRLGLCIPSSCGAQDMYNIFYSVIEGHPLEVEVQGCEVKEELVFNFQQIIITVIFGILAIVLILATAADLLLEPEKRPTATGALSVLLHFSMYANGKRLMKTEVKTNRLTCLNGMKVLCITWILLTHTFQFSLRYSMNRMLNFVDFAKTPFFTIIVGAYYVTDTFFLIGGLLVANMGMMYMESSNGRLNIIGFYIRRIWRLLPSIMFITGMTIIIPLMGSGPLWKEVVTREGEVCQRTWWANLLFITSWFDYYDMCLVHLWFVSVDMLLYVFSPFLLIFFYKKPKWALVLSCGLIFASCLCSALIVVIYELDVFLPVNLEQFHKYKDFLQLNHFMFMSHVGPYVVGFLLGYLIYIKSEIKISKLMVLLGWTVSTVLALTAIMCSHNWLNGLEPTVPEMAAHQSLNRIIWAASNAWVIFACCYGYAGWANTILSWKVFIPFNRLVYMIYLTQLPVMWVRLGSKKHTVPLEHIETIYEFFGNTIVVVFVSTFTYLAVEAPFASLDYVLFGKPAIKTRRVSRVIGNSLRLKDLTTQNGDKDFEKGSMPENYVHRRKRSEDDVMGELTASMVTTVAPESEPCTETEEQAKKIAELGLDQTTLTTLRLQNRRLSQILDNLKNDDLDANDANKADNQSAESEKRSPPPILTQRKTSNECLNANLNLNKDSAEKDNEKNMVELTNLKNLS